MIEKIRTLGKMLTTLKNPDAYLKDYFKLTKRGEIFYRLRNGVKYKLRAGSTDRFIINEVWLHRSYTPEGFGIGRDDTVVDIGAHAGIFAMLAAHYAKNGKVYAFEPVLDNFLLLKENIRINGAENVEAVNRAVSAKSGKLKLFVSESKNKGQNSIHQLAKDQVEKIVDKQSFKAFLKPLKKIDFLKIDCEGSEYEILFSLSNQELSKIKKIALEYHNYGKYTGDDLKNFLMRNGFDVRLVREGKQFGTIYARR